MEQDVGMIGDNNEGQEDQFSMMQSEFSYNRESQNKNNDSEMGSLSSVPKTEPIYSKDGKWVY